MEFSQLKLLPQLLEAVDAQGYTNPSPIQEKAIPPALEGKDILGCAQTGTGKTAAFALPILQRLAVTDGFTESRQAYNYKSPRRSVRALVLTPTRELALQIQESVRAYGRKLPYRCTVVMGGVSMQGQIQELKRGCDILVATPGRLLDLAAQQEVDLKHIEVFVLDEADRMLDMGFIHDVRRVLTLLPQKKQTLFFTATLPPEIVGLAKSLLYSPVEVAVTPVSSTVESTVQKLYYTDKMKKMELLTYLLTDGELTTGSTLVFTRTKYGADKLVSKLKRSGLESMAIHGDKSQGARVNALESFKSGKIRVLIATDIAARGIDIEELACVVNYELPNVAETYVHRIGRTGRAGRTGLAVSLCDYDEKPYVTDIEKLIKRKLEVVAEHPYPMTVFVKSPPKEHTPRPQGQRTNGNFRYRR